MLAVGSLKIYCLIADGYIALVCQLNVKNINLYCRFSRHSCSLKVAGKSWRENEPMVIINQLEEQPPTMKAVIIIQFGTFGSFTSNLSHFVLMSFEVFEVVPSAHQRFFSFLFFFHLYTDLDCAKF